MFVGMTLKTAAATKKQNKREWSVWTVHKATTDSNRFAANIHIHHGNAALHAFCDGYSDSCLTFVCLNDVTHTCIASVFQPNASKVPKTSG